MNGTWVIAAEDAAVASLLDLAGGLDAPVRVLVVGSAPVAQTLAAAGLTVDWFDATDAPAAALATAAAAHVLAAGSVGAVLAGTGPDSRLVAGAIAAACGAQIVGDVTQVAQDGTDVVATHLLYGGLVEQTVAVRGPVLLVAGAHGTPAGAVPGLVARIGVPDLGPVRRLAVAPRPPAGEDLHEATRVVGVGRGLRDEADLAMLRELAGALGAQLACSRPLAEGLGWLPTERYLGISGARIAPELYVAVGISGQGQHMIGVRDAGTIVAVNTDPQAAIVDQADWTLVGDLYDVVPALTKALAGTDAP